MPELRVALLQLTAQGVDLAANAAKGERACREAKQLGADIALFPEMWSIGYSSFLPTGAEPPDVWRSPGLWNRFSEPPVADDYTAARAAWQALAIGRGDPFVRRYCDLASELGMAIGLTILEQWSEAPRNTLLLIDRHGEIVLAYAKVHTCCFSPLEAALTPGTGFPVAALDTPAGVVQVGAMICFDREFPESARLLMLNGAELILVPNACEMERHRVGQLRSRAWENLVAVALANYAAPQQNGHSVAFDPIAFDDAGRSRDNLVIEAGETEGVYLARFNLEALLAFREREVLGSAFRRPSAYAGMLAAETRPPFVRVDREGNEWRPS